MKKKMYCLYNNKAKAYLTPVVGYPSLDGGHEATLEYFATYIKMYAEVDNVKPSEFDLFYIADFDTDKGQFELLEVKEHLCNCLELVAAEEEKKKEELDHPLFDGVKINNHNGKEIENA